jgi:hypothetical protein
MTLSEQAFEVLRILGLPRGELARYVPPDSDHLCYRFSDSDGGLDISTGAKAALLSARTILRHFFGTVDAPAAGISLEVIGEIMGLMEMMFDLAEYSVDYHWHLDKSGYASRGPYDVGWEILRRLACSASARSTEKPRLSFGDLIQLAGGRPTAVEPSDEHLRGDEDD